MFRIRFRVIAVVLSFVLVAALAGCASGPRALAERAVEAHGGMEALEGIETVHLESEGTWIAGMPPYTTVQHIRRPMDWRWELKSAMGDMTAWVLGAEQAAYASMMGFTTEKTGDLRTGYTAHARAACVPLLPDLLLADDVTLRKTDPVTIDGASHPAVEADWGDGPPLTFVMDSESGRIRRVMFRYFDEENLRWIDGHGDSSDWREVDGIQVAFHADVTMGEDPAAFVLRENVKQVVFNRVPEEGLFARPEAQPPLEVRVKREPATTIAHMKMVGSYEQMGAAVETVMGWITSNGGTPAGPVTTIFKKPMNYAEPEKSEAILQVPMTMDAAPPAGDVRRLYRREFDLAYISFEGPIMAAMMQWGAIHEWCRRNGYRRSGARRMTVLAMDEESGNATVEVGFPVRRAQ